MSNNAVLRSGFKGFLCRGSSWIIVLLEAMNIGVVYPLVVYALVSPHVTFFPPGLTPFEHTLAYGALIAVFMLGSFVASFFVARRQQLYGQKRTLVIGLSTAIVGYLVAAYGLRINSYTLLLLGRAIAGLSVGMQPVIQELLLVGFTQVNSAARLRAISLVSAFGVVLGPIFGAVFMQHKLSLYFHLETPMVLMAVISAMVLLCVLSCFASDKAPNASHTSGKAIVFMPWLRDFSINFKRSFKHPLTLSFMGFLFSWACLYFFAAWFADGVFDYNAIELSFFMACFSLGFLLGIVIFNCLDMATRSPGKFIVESLLSVVAICIVMFCVQQQVIAWGGIFLIGFFIAIAYPCFYMLLMKKQSGALPGHFYGQVMPVLFAVASLFSGLVDHWHYGACLLVGALGLLITVIVFSGSSNKAIKKQGSAA